MTTLSLASDIRPAPAKQAPSSVLDHPLQLRWSVPLLLLLIGLPMMAAQFGGEYYVGVASRVLIYAIAATSLNLILGFGGMVSFGHAAFVGVGAYTVGIMMGHGIDSAWVAWPAAMCVGALSALLVGMVSLRTQGVYFIMITLAVAQMLYYLVVSLKAFGGEDGISLASRSVLWEGFDLQDDAHFYYLVLSLLVGVTVGVQRLLNASFGQVLQAIRENETRATALGFAVFRHKLIAFTLAGAVAGLAGALLANQGDFVSPAMLQWNQSGVLMVMVILGGVGHLYGGLAGAAAFLLLEEVLSGFTEHWQFALGALLLTVVLVAPNGLLSLVRSRNRS